MHIKDETGHWIGADGYVCPLTFAAFLDRYPDYILLMARKMAPYSADPSAAEDMAQDICYRLMANQAVEQFDAVLMHGATERRFFGYITQHIRWAAGKQRDSNALEPILSPVASGISHLDKDDPYNVTEEHISTYRLTDIPLPDANNAIYLADFAAFVAQQGRKDLVKLMVAIFETKNYTQAGIACGLKHRQVTFKLTTLRKLGKLFASRRRG